MRRARPKARHALAALALALAAACSTPDRHPGAGDSDGGGGGSGGEDGAAGAGGRDADVDRGPAPDAGPGGGCGGAPGHPPASPPGANKWEYTSRDGDSFVGLGHAAVWDKRGDRLLLTGGYRVGRGTPARFYEFDGTSDWKSIAADAAVVGRAFHAMAYDEKEGALVQFGGVRDSWGGIPPLGDTWIYAGTWSEAKGGPAPPARWGAEMVYDSRRGKLWLFGGAGSGDKPFADTWQFDTKERKWSAVATPAAPPPRFMHAMGFSSGDGRVYLFGGFDGKKSLGDTWVFDPDSATYCELAPSVAPARRGETELVYLPEKAVFVLYGGRGRGGPEAMFSDTWVFEPATTSWKDLKPPVGRQSAAHVLVFFGKLGKVVLYGGYGDSPGGTGTSVLHGIFVYGY